MSESDDIAPQQHDEGVDAQEIGNTLAHARERCELTQEQLAQRLNLTVRKLDDLEQGQFDKLGAPIFIKGYIKAYCKVVGLDAADVLQSYTPKQQAEPQASMQSFSKRTEKEAHDHRLMVVSYIIIAIIIGSSLFWWWQNSDSSADAGNTNAPSVPKLEADVAAQQVASANTTEQLASTPVATDTDEPALAELEVGPSSEPEQQARVETEKQTTSNVSDEPQSAAPATEPLAAGEQKVIMRFSGECWVEVQDAKGKRLVYDIKRAGQAVELVGLAPFAVTLGKHDVVEITLNGEAVDISQFPKNRLAKFSLPLTE